MSWLRSPGVRLWLLWGGHALLFVAALAAGALLRDRFDAIPVVLPVALTQWGLLALSFGLGPFRWPWRVMLFLLFLLHLAAVWWAIEAIEAIRDQGFYQLDLWTALRDDWEWPEREREFIGVDGHDVGDLDRALRRQRPGIEMRVEKLGGRHAEMAQEPQ